MHDKQIFIIHFSEWSEKKEMLYHNWLSTLLYNTAIVKAMKIKWKWKWIWHVTS